MVEVDLRLEIVTVKALERKLFDIFWRVQKHQQCGIRLRRQYLLFTVSQRASVLIGLTRSNGATFWAVSLSGSSATAQDAQASASGPIRK